jgi:hypothetical protein
MLGPGAIIVVSIASTTPEPEIRRPDELVSVASANQDAVMLQPVAEPTWLREAQNRLTELGRLPDGWGGSEKPSDRARNVALAVIGMMERHGHRVLHIAPIADGGIALSYLEGDRSARFDVYNDEGGIVVATCAGYEASTEYAELPEAEAVAALASFLQYD